MNSLLPNLRWLSLQSENSGHDWLEKSQMIDSVLGEQGMDLSEESVYLLYSDSPEKILSGAGECLISRAVIGPKKTVEGPFLLKDWTAAPVWEKKLSAQKLEDLLEEAVRFRQSFVQNGEELASGFILVVKRRHLGDLKISIEVMYYR